MDIIQWRNGLTDPFQGFEDLQEEINKLFDTLRLPEPQGIFERSFSPAVDIIENPNSYEVITDLPGVEIRDIEISTSGNVLTLKGEKRKELKSEGARVYREETRVGRFQRTLQLPMSVDAEKVDATLKDGVLRIVLPKREEHRAKQIDVKTA